MENIHSFRYKNTNKEEFLPGFSEDFPYIASYAELDKYIGQYVPWHWHKEMELFYLDNGVLEYYTPKGKTVFPAGSGGLLNSNVLHMTKPQKGAIGTTQMIHLFDSSLIGGQQGSRIEQKYITPLTAAPHVEIIPLYPDIPEQKEILDDIRLSFALSKDDFAYEIQLRSALSGIWCRLFRLSEPLLREKENPDKTNGKLKQMMIYIHEHYAEKISVKDIADSAFISERECFRAFHNYLHMTPVEYLKGYRLQSACHMLAKSQESITFISHSCGLGSSSYFGKVFRDCTGYTPLEYRRKWQDNDIYRQK